MRNAMNEVTRGSYVKDCEIGVIRWNRLIEKAGYSFRLALPSTRFRRNIGDMGGSADRHDGQADFTGRIQRAHRRLVAERQRSGLHHEPDARRARAWEDGGVDCAARSRHQQQPGRLRICKAALMRHIAIVGSGPAGFIWRINCSGFFPTHPSTFWNACLCHSA